MARSSSPEGRFGHSRLSQRARAKAGEPRHDRSLPWADRKPADVNFASIISLDSSGGWHILRLSLEGSVLSADAAAVKVLRQFFGEMPHWSGELPAPLAQKFYESRNWGMSRSLRRNWRSFTVVRFGLKLTAHLKPDVDGGYLVLKTGPANAPDQTAVRARCCYARLPPG